MARSVPGQGLALIVFLLVVGLAAMTGGILTSAGVGSWYQEIMKPPWTPPDWVFAPVWTVLYVMMAVAAWLVWRAEAPRRLRGWALGLWGLPLVLNVAWSGLFFYLRMPGAAFAEVVVLWAAILATTAAFWRVTILAGVLFLPYLAWTTFAAVLNFVIWRINI